MRRFAVAALLVLACGEPTTPPATGPAPHGLLYLLPDPGDTSGAVMLALADGTGAHRLPLAWPARPVFAPDGVRLAFTADGETLAWGKHSQVSVADTAGHSLFPSPSQSGSGRCYRWAASSVSWSPDGRLLAYLCVGAGALTLVLRDLVADTIASVVLDPMAGDPPVSWSPDGVWVLVGTRLVNVARTRADVSLTVPAGTVGLGWTPDKRVVLGSTSACGTGAYLMDPRAGAPAVAFLAAPYRAAVFASDNRHVLAMTGACSGGDVPSLRLLDRMTLHVEWSMDGVTWATWRP